MVISNQTLDEERALYGLEGARVQSCRFDGPADGESALKECRNIEAEDCYFNLRYPLWHAANAVLRGCEMTENCRAALWYDDGAALENCRVHGVKALRECRNVTLTGDEIVSAEFLWRCRGVKITNCRLVSEYPLFECADVRVEGLTMKGKYSFQYVENAEIHDSGLDTKDAFWHAKNVAVYDSVIRGEYLGWYSENLRLVRCRIIGTQPLCYCRGLVLEDCEMEDADLCFERSEVRAAVRGGIVSVKNPARGSIVADAIGEIIMEPAYTRPDQVEIRVR